MRTTKRIIITITFAGISLLAANDNIKFNEEFVSAKEDVNKEESLKNNSKLDKKTEKEKELDNNIVITNKTVMDQKARAPRQNYIDIKDTKQKAYIKRQYLNKYHPNLRQKVKKQAILNSIKLRYLNKVNQIENCILIADTVDELNICSQRVHTLSKDINKMKHRINKQKKKQKKFNKKM